MENVLKDSPCFSLELLVVKSSTTAPVLVDGSGYQ